MHVAVLNGRLPKLVGQLSLRADGQSTLFRTTPNAQGPARGSF